MSNYFLRAAFTICLTLSFGSMAYCQDPDRSKKDPPDTAELSINDQQIIQAIKDIRRQLGGLDLQVEPQPILKLLNNEQAVGPRLGISRQNVESEFDRQLRKRVAADTVTKLPTPIQSTLPRPASRVESLRLAARHLDLAAANLEDAELFAQADELRARAHEIRLSARKLVETASAKPPLDR